MRDDKLIEAMRDDKLIEAMGFEIESTACVDQKTAENAARAALAAAEAAGYRLVSQDRLATIWSGGYEAGHSDGIGCGHPLARMCRHSGDESAADNAEEIAMLAAAPQFEEDEK